MIAARLLGLLLAPCIGLPALVVAPPAQAQVTAATLPVTKGRYRLPYANGTEVRANNDHRNHPAARNRMDLGGRGGGPYTIVAAADGWLRLIEDDNTLWCPGATDSNPDPCGGAANCCESGDTSCNANCRNNFVWIEHTNGEWSKYSHMRTGSVAANNHQVDDFVQAGEPLGIEGQVGFASGPHLHFEVAVPIDGVDSIGDSGFLGGDADPATGDFPDTDDNPNDYNRQNRVIAFCTGGSSGIWLAGTQVAAADCAQSCVGVLSPNAVAVAGSVTHGQANLVTPGAGFRIDAGGSRGVRAQTRVTLAPGFRVAGDGFFVASIGACDSPGAGVAASAIAGGAKTLFHDGLPVIGEPPPHFAAHLPSCQEPGMR